jgi:hypothetical protein
VTHVADEAAPATTALAPAEPPTPAAPAVTKLPTPNMTTLITSSKTRLPIFLDSDHSFGHIVYEFGANWAMFGVMQRFQAFAEVAELSKAKSIVVSPTSRSMRAPSRSASAASWAAVTTQTRTVATCSHTS